MIIYLFDSSHLSGSEVVSHCDFDYISLMANDIKHLFMCLLAIYLSSLAKCLLQILCPFLN